MRQPGEKFKLEGFVGDRFDANIEQWLIMAPYVNPAMFEMYRQRDNKPQKKLAPWYGEFSGKYLTSAVLSYFMSRDDRLREVICYTVDQLEAIQADDGYLGVFAEDNRLIGHIHPDMKWNVYATWDVWGHYHNMLGLYLWYKLCGDEKALKICLKAADYMYDFFITGRRRIEDAQASEMNLSVSHIYALLYLETRDGRYLEMTRYIFKAFESPGCGNFVNGALSGLEFYQMELPRWEGLHAVQAIGEMYRITDDMTYKQAFENIWWSILKTDRHNTGGFSSGEQAQGNPYDLRPIETCCTIAWTALSVDMLKLSDLSYVADEIELTTFNGILGAQHPSGRYFTYNSPMIGEKKSSAHEISFQAIAGSPELNCCSVNGPRGIGMISEWGIIRNPDCITINYYGPSTAVVQLDDGNAITLIQETDYPRSGNIRLKVKLDKPLNLSLRLRIPFWSGENKISLNGVVLEAPQPMTYYSISRTFESGDEISLQLDLSLHFWTGDSSVAGRTSIYRGPLLLAYDQRWNPGSFEDPPTLLLDNLVYSLIDNTEYPEPWILCRFINAEGKAVFLCDYATAGAVGTGFSTWIPMKSRLEPPVFSRTEPVWGQVAPLL